MSNLIVLDTNVIIPLTTQPAKLSNTIKNKIYSKLDNGEVLISSITLLEIATLRLNNRLGIFEPIDKFLESIAYMRGLTVVDITPQIASQSISLGSDFPDDPADRIIASTTICYGATLLTSDAKIIDWAKHGHMKVLEV